MRDFDGDGQLDIATPTSGSPQDGGVPKAGFSIVYLDKNLQPAAYSFLTVAGWPGFFFEAGDLNGDGRVDVVASTLPKLIVFFNQGGRDKWLRVEYPGQQGIVAMGDFDRDGKVDLLSVECDLLLYRNQGGGALALRQAIPLPLQTACGDYYAPAVADLDGDGRLDIALGGEDRPDHKFSMIAVFLNRTP